MRDFIISTETTADLPEQYIKEHKLQIHTLYYKIDETVYGGELELNPKDFYDKMRAGAAPTTMASNPDLIREAFKKTLEQGYDILHIAFSSALSSSYNNAAFVGRELQEAYPDAKIIVIDSLCASLGQGLLVNSAVQLKEAGKPIDEVAAWLEDNKLHLCHQFTVEDLIYLHRGGRIKKSIAILGTIISAKPVMHVDNEGRLVPLNNVHGRKKSLTALVDNMAAGLDGFDMKNDWVFISHGDSLEDATLVRNMVEERFGIHNFIINNVSPTIGSHSGPGTIALFYYGKAR